MKADIYIHPKALVETNEVSEGTRIWAFAHGLKGAAGKKRVRRLEGEKVR